MKIFILSLCLIFSLPSISVSQVKQALTLSDIYDSDKFTEESLEHSRWIPETEAFTFLRADEIDSVTSIYKYDAESQNESLLVDGHTLYLPGTDILLQIESYEWSEDGSKILIATDTEDIWRNSKVGKYYICDMADISLQPVFDTLEEISNAKLSPDGTMVGYVFENNIYTKTLSTGTTNRLTEDGSDVIINGQFDWVYEEEFWITDGWQWAPDSKTIAFWRLDQSAEPELSLIDYKPLHQSVTSFRYPKAGEANASVKIGVIHLDDGETVWMDLGEGTDIYVPRIKWTDDTDVLSIQRLNRHQNKLDLLLADVNTGETETVLTETDSCWVEVHDNLIFLEDTDQFLWTSERSGYNHIYLYQNDGTLIRQVTEGKWEVRSVYGADEEAGIIYFSSNQEDVTERHIYGIRLDGSSQQRLTQETGWHSADFSPQFHYFIHSYSSSTTPSKVTLCLSDGNTVSTLIENRMEVLDSYELSYPEFLTVTTEDGVELNAQIMLPRDFDASKKYPVLVSCYGGPWQVVSNSWEGKSFLWHNFLAQQGYIVFSIDNRGTTGRGKAFVNMVYGDLGKWAVHDHIEAAKYLAGLPYVDKDRIGVFGWSFGGYLTLLAMTKGAGYFSTGVAGAPVVCFRLYDTIYTERYMRLPDENQLGYDSASVFSYADRLEGNLLIIHGTSDDNVHVQNTMQLAERLQEQGKQFDLMLYPGKDHDVAGSGDTIALHLYTLITNYLLENL